MSSYNRGEYLAEAIESVLTQNYSNWELVIADDGSHNPLTLEILEHYECDPRIKVHYLIHNYGGGIFAKNYAISQAKGEFLAILDDDDITYPNRLQIQVDYMKAHPQIDIVAAQQLPFNSETKESGWLTDSVLDHPDIIKFRTMFFNCLSHSTIFVRRERLADRFYYEYFGAEDYYLWLKLMFDNSEHEDELLFGFINQPLTGYRHHKNRISNDKNQVQSWNWTDDKICETLGKMFPKSFGGQPADYLTTYTIQKVAL